MCRNLSDPQEQAILVPLKEPIRQWAEKGNGLRLNVPVASEGSKQASGEGGAWKEAAVGARGQNIPAMVGMPTAL